MESTALHPISSMIINSLVISYLTKNILMIPRLMIYSFKNLILYFKFNYTVRKTCTISTESFCFKHTALNTLFWTMRTQNSFPSFVLAQIIRDCVKQRISSPTSSKLRFTVTIKTHTLIFWETACRVSSYVHSCKRKCACITTGN